MDLSHELYSEDIEKVVEKLKLETARELNLDEAVFLWSKSYSIKTKQNISPCKQNGVQDHDKYILEDPKYCLVNNEN